jgi:hypothetical protein
MSLAMTAATLESLDINDNHSIGQKRKIMQQQQQVSSQNNNKTRKQLRTSETVIDNDKVNSVLASIHKGFSDEDDDDTFANIQTLSASSEKPSAKNKVSKIEQMTNQNESDGLVPTPLEKSEMDLQKLENNYMNDDEVEKYYKKIMPGYNYNHNEINNIKKYNSQQNISSTQHNSSRHDTNNPVIDKLNYIINLLEEQQDQRTNNVTEEVILYSFLGVFIIFVVDGFTRVGKYIR